MSAWALAVEPAAPKVVRVTSLDSAGPGTLREALSAKCPRVNASSKIE